MAIFNSKMKEDYDRLIKENEELRNSLHESLDMTDSMEELGAKLAEKKNKLSELSKEEKSIEEFILKTNEDKVNKSFILGMSFDERRVN